MKVTSNSSRPSEPTAARSVERVKAGTTGCPTWGGAGNPETPAPCGEPCVPGAGHGLVSRQPVLPTLPGSPENGLQLEPA